MDQKHSIFELNLCHVSCRLAAALLTLLVHAGAGAADKNPASAMQAYLAKDYAAALRLWQPDAARGDAESQYSLGVMYANGEGVAKDPIAAAAWYRKAPEAGDTGAGLAYAKLMKTGTGVPKNTEEALKSFKAVAKITGLRERWRRTR